MQRFALTLTAHACVCAAQSQGQTCAKINIVLAHIIEHDGAVTVTASPCFAHGQFYTASSRTGDPQGCFYWLDPVCFSTLSTDNVVYKEALLPQDATEKPGSYPPYHANPCHRQLFDGSTEELDEQSTTSPTEHDYTTAFDVAFGDHYEDDYEWFRWDGSIQTVQAATMNGYFDPISAFLEATALPAHMATDSGVIQSGDIPNCLEDLEVPADLSQLEDPDDNLMQLCGIDCNTQWVGRIDDDRLDADALLDLYV